MKEFLVEIQNPQKFVILKINYLSLFYLTVCCLFFSTQSIAQSSSHKKRDNIDIKLWGGAELGLKLNKSWSISLMTQARMKSMAREFDRFLLEFETAYNPRFHSFVKPMKLKVGARYFGTVDEDDGYENNLRLHADLSYKLKLKRFHVAYRFRYQAKNELKQKESIYKNYWTQDFRNLIRIGYNFKKWKLDPEIWVELFFHDELGALDGFTKYRVGFKTSYDFDENNAITLKYFLEMETKYYDPKQTHVIALSYQYKFKLKKRK